MRALPAVLACLLLGAHFLRAGDWLGVGAGLGLAVLACVPRRGPRLVARVGLVLGVLLWVQTAWSVYAARTAAGEPGLRALLILLAVAAFTAVAAWLLPPGPRTSS